jgi:hypothetical protein
LIDHHGRHDDDDDIDYDAEYEQYAAEQQRKCDEEMRRIVTNDPPFTTMSIDSGRMENDWEVLGTAVGRNTQLTR